MAFFGVQNSGGLFGNQNSGGLFGSGGQQSFRLPIVGIDTSLIALSSQAQLARISLSSLSAEQRASQFNFDRGPAVRGPGADIQEAKSLNERIREVREISNFIDLKASNLKAVENNVDQKATFVLFNALDKLRVLAEYAAEDSTSDSSLERLDEQFQSGLNEVREYLATTELNRLDVFLGEKTAAVEATTRTGKNETGFTGSFVATSADDVITGLTGTEVLTVSIEKGGVKDDITVDLSQISGDLTLNSVVGEINAQIEALTDLDDEGEPFSRHQTRFDVSRDSETGNFGISIDGTLTEEVTLSAAAAEPTLYAVSSVTQFDDSFAVTSRISEFKDITGTITLDDTTSFAAIDYAATEIKGLVVEEEEDGLDENISALRDKFRADALSDVVTEDTSSSEDDDVDNASSITNIDAENRVNADTVGSRVAVDSDGGIYVVGTSSGSFGHQLNSATEQDVFLTKFDTEGNVIFSRLLGVADSAEAFDIKVDSNDNVIIAGATANALSSSDVVDSASDAFVVKISKRGDEVFRYQLDTFGSTAAYSIAVDSNDDIYVGGKTSSAISSSSGFSGGDDALILKLNGANGTLTDSTVFGSSGNDSIKGLALDANGDLIVAVEEGAGASVYRISGTDLTNQTAGVSLGPLGNGGSIEGIAIDTDNNKVYVSGVTSNASLDAAGTASINETPAGGIEGFVTGLSYAGTSSLTADFTTYLTTSGTDQINDLTVQGGKVFVAGTTTETLSGETSRGALDGFVARVDGTTGALEDAQQFGEGLARSAVGGIAFTNRGDSVLETLGLPTGLIAGDETLDLQTQTTARPGDHFFLSFDGGRRTRIELQQGDDFDNLARKIRVAGYGRLEVDVSGTSEGDRLKINALDHDGVSVELIAGADGEDLLQRLGIKEGRLLPRDEVLGLNDDDIPPEEDLGGVFSLNLEGALNLRDKPTSRYVLGLLDNAVSTVQRAFRSLTFNPIRQQLLDSSRTQGPVPPRIAAQIANFQSGLARLQSGASSSSFSLFA